MRKTSEEKQKQNGNKMGLLGNLRDVRILQYPKKDIEYQEVKEINTYTFGGRIPYPKRTDKLSKESLATDEAKVLPERKNHLNSRTKVRKHVNDLFSSRQSKISATVITQFNVIHAELDG